MTIDRTEFHKQVKGSLMQDEDKWVLITDKRTGERFVEHAWSHVDPAGQSASDTGERKIPVAEFLHGDADPAIKAKLNAVLGR